MRLQEIYQINYSIIDRGSEYSPQPIETNDKDSKRAVKNHLKKWSYAMDLSKGYKFKIDKVSSIGYEMIF